MRTPPRPFLRNLGFMLVLWLLDSNDAASSDTSPQPPIFVMNLAKSGTTSIHKFFQCGGYNSVHHRHRRNLLEEWGTKLLDRDLGPLVGKCMKQNLQYGQLPLDNCGHYQVWSDLSYTDTDDCFFPTFQEDTLEQLYQAYPEATWILTIRNETEWYRSLSTFLGGKVLSKWNRCFADERINVLNTTDAQFWVEFYTNHTDRIDHFVKEHPSLRYFIIPLKEAPQTLSEGFGIPLDCFDHHRSSRYPWNRLIDTLETNLLL